VPVGHFQLPITDFQVPIGHFQLPIVDFQVPNIFLPVSFPPSLIKVSFILEIFCNSW
jgi:hypothetical protein